ncbi:MAG TPA: response regulator [Polyangiaceae bacterium]|jgi:CheY-like chemotaxis protein|nr:response regulator [Polyangiaceae bacterium]
MPENGRRAILVVDDDSDIRAILGAVLEAEGYHVSEAPNGEIALRVVRNAHKPDLMLLDLMMPVLSGFELLEMAADGDPDLNAVPIFVISAFGEPPTAKGPGGVKRAFRKPIDMGTLLTAVHQQLD